jgi:NAD(P)-dependent dehydrogenase (short-subunit alcohol dehydrogenase family)
MPMGKSRWKADQIPELSGKVIIVTGANTGIGFQSALEFARKGAETILACRNEKKGLRAVSNIKKRLPGARVRFLQLDLSSLRSIHLFAEIFKKEYSRLDVLLNNAGIIWFPYRTTEDGFESQMGVNHLGHFALTGLLLGLIKKTDGARVVLVSSIGHRMGRMDFDNFLYQGGKGYSRSGAYGRSKLANLLYTHELNRRFRKANMHAMAVAAHPGFSYTDFGRRSLLKSLKFIFYPIILLVTQSSSMGALPSLRAAVDPEVNGTDYFGPAGIGERKGYPVKVESNEASHNEEDARKLWEISEELTGVRYL